MVELDKLVHSEANPGARRGIETVARTVKGNELPEIGIEVPDGNKKFSPTVSDIRAGCSGCPRDYNM